MKLHIDLPLQTVITFLQISKIVQNLPILMIINLK